MDMDITTRTFDERDEFRRKSIAEKAIKLLKSDIDISPMVIDGGWGTGKTEFCHKLINLMKEDDTHSVIYIDAFKADHINEPLMTVLAEIIKILPNESTRERFIKRVLPTVRFSLKSLAKAGISHLLRQDFADVAEDFTNEIEEATDKAIDATAELILKEHVEAEKNLQTLQAALTAISSQNPIVIFIDELDRCRPNFAIDMLEMIKHTFDVKDVSFVLITNTQQLRASINHCYGQAVDAQRYLDKFIKFRFELSAHSIRDLNYPVLAATDHFFKLARDKECLPNELLGKEHFRKAIEHLVRHQNLSLREIETLILHIQIVQNLSNSETFSGRMYFGYVLLRLIAVILVCYEPTLLNKIKNGIIDADLLGEFLGVKEIPIINLGSLENTEIIRPEPFEVIMVMLAKDCNQNAEKYIPSEDRQDEWNSYISSFMDGLPYNHRAMKIIIETANIMAFE
ncbi:P-loop NTPase fold protein [uncultured Psychrobacter sp.]|uniref:KAP family P-loop NTPase fold protein n=1 Tax=uncultured Psychrobacter sp. TaxID=259303 RepID=UPI00262C1D35|nr:P-loop NTPase fold protein [uncultured Psychrobacter sp.]